MTKEVRNIDAEKNFNSAKTTVINVNKIISLRSKLLIAVLPTVLIPLVIASTFGYIITERRAKNQAFNDAENKAITVSMNIDTFIRNSFDITEVIASNPEVIQAMKNGSNLAREQKLIQQSLPALEKQFADTKLLSENQRLNNYLQQIVRSGKVAEIFLTERNGFNVAYSNLTSNFVQRDKKWWQMSLERGLGMDEPGFDESANQVVIPFSRRVKDPQTGEFLGVLKAAIPITNLRSDIDSYFTRGKTQSSSIQIADLDEGFVLYSSNAESDSQSLQDTDDDDDQEQEKPSIAQNTDNDDENRENINLVGIGNEAILKTIDTLVKVEGNSLSFEALGEAEEENLKFWSLAEASKIIAQQPGFVDVSLRQEKILSETITIASFIYRGNLYTISTVPQTDFVSIEILDYDLILAEARAFLKIFAVATAVLGTASLASILILAQQLSRPLTNLSARTQEVAQGNLDVTASVEGTWETRTLAKNFNLLVDRVKNLLQEQKILANEQRQEKEKLEKAIYTLIEEVSDATQGDLTVRASLDSLELSTVADLFNAIIDNLQEIAIEAKQSTNQVGSSLKQNEAAILALAEQAITEAKETRDTLKSVEQMSRSIQEVAENASQAEKIADDNYNTIVNSTDNMDLTVNSILNLRNTVGETAKKMKRLGESSQKISQAVSFIEEIALKTNVLAINASVEAGRAGEYGQGFTIVAEQVGALAAQSATATKEIASIVAAIQAETQQVSQAMETGTTQVVESTKLVEVTKESLRLVLEKSQTINQLMESISQATVSQAHTSQNVTSLMQKIAQLSENTSQSSKEVAQSIVATAEVAQKLESTVAQFKVAE
jgi:methyl-accepting chemotaxis protein PixJ